MIGIGEYNWDRRVYDRQVDTSPRMHTLMEDEWLRQITVITTMWFVLMFAAGISLILFAGAFATL